MNGFCDAAQLIIGCVDKQLKLIQSFFKILKKLWILGTFFPIDEKILKKNNYKIINILF